MRRLVPRLVSNPPNPWTSRHVGTVAAQGSRKVLVRLRRRRYTPPVEGLEPLPDDMPRAGLFAEPIRVVRLQARDPEPQDDGSVIVEFRATVKDAEGKRCPDLAVEATMTGPHRTGSGTATTDLMGTVRFRMPGPVGSYRITIDDVAAGALELDTEASTMTADITV